MYLCKHALNCCKPTRVPLDGNALGAEAARRNPRATARCARGTCWWTPLQLLLGKGMVGSGGKEAMQVYFGQHHPQEHSNYGSLGRALWWWVGKGARGASLPPVGAGLRDFAAKDLRGAAVDVGLAVAAGRPAGRHAQLGLVAHAQARLFDSERGMREEAAAVASAAAAAAANAAAQAPETSTIEDRVPQECVEAS